MRKGILLSFALMFVVGFSFGQHTRILQITYDATIGVGNLDTSTTTSVYMHSGAGSTDSDTYWEHVVGNWGQDDGLGKMAAAGTNLWTIVLDYDIYYGPAGLASGAEVYTVACVFRSPDGSREGKDDNNEDIKATGMDTATPTVNNNDGTAFSGVTMAYLQANSIDDVLQDIGVANYTAFPNPATGSQITISYEVLTSPKNVELTIFNTVGRKVTELVRGTQSTGVHEVVWNLDSVAPGVYFYRLVAEGLIATRKIVVE